MAKVGGFGKHDIPFQAKLRAYKYLMGQCDSYKLTEEEELAMKAKSHPSPIVD